MSKTMPATKFKAHVLALLDQVARTGEKIIVTKHGKPVAELRPTPLLRKRKSLYGSIRVVGDIVAPQPDKWEADS